MAEISASLVKSLREETGLGMMECKRALAESEGDVGKARDLLRVRGHSKAEKVSGRSATEGRVGIETDGARGCVAQVNCETDFVAKDGNFQEFVGKVARAALDAGSDNPGSLPEVEEARKGLVMKLGENVTIGRCDVLDAGAGRLASYIHQGAKIGVLASFAGEDPDPQAMRDVCMHIAAMRPTHVSPSDVPSDALEKEREIYRAQAAETGKPPQVVEKIVDGKVQRHLEEQCLLLQAFVRDDGKTVQEFLGDKGLTVQGFVRAEVGRRDGS